MQFSYYKTVNCIATCGVVQCTVTCVVVHLCHFVGSFGAFFAICAVWWTPLLTGVECLWVGAQNRNLTPLSIFFIKEFSSLDWVLCGSKISLNLTFNRKNLEDNQVKIYLKFHLKYIQIRTLLRHIWFDVRNICQFRIS